MEENLQNEAEARLIADLHAGSRSAFVQLVELYSPRMYRVALRITGNEQDAEDVLQETFLKVLRGLPSFEGRSRLSTWLYRIAVNEALMLVRRRKGDMLSLDEERETEEGDFIPFEIVDWGALPESKLLDSEGRAYMEQSVQKLSPGQRAVFTLRDIEGLSVRETAEALSVSEEVVKTRLLRARLKLRELLSVYYREHLPENLSE